MDGETEALRREAAALIVRLHSGEASRDDLAQVQAWRMRSPEHEAAFVTEARLWKQLGPALNAVAQPERARLSRRATLGWGGLAAASAVTGIGLSELGWLPPVEGLWADHATGFAERRSVDLPDGSQAELDAGSVLTIDFTQTQRRAGLSAGAAWFNVRPSETRFTLATGSGDVSTTGAEFAVVLGAASAEVDCLAGTVALDGGAMALAAGEGARLSPGRAPARVPVLRADAAAWRRGQLIFNDRSFADVISDLNRHRRGKIFIARDALNEHRVSGTFHLDRPEQILATLEASFGLDAVNLPGGIVLLR